MKPLICLLSFLFFSHSLYAEDPFKIRITSDSEPLAVVGGCVNALSGEFFYVEQDLAPSRAGALNYTRVYDSGSIMPNVLGYGWGSIFAKDFYFFEFKDKKKTKMALAGSAEYDLLPFAAGELQGSLLKGNVYDGIYQVGYTNSVEALLMGEPSFCRTEVFCHNYEHKQKEEQWEVRLPNGTVRIYEKLKDKIKYENATKNFFLLIREDLPNGHIRHISYLPDSNCFKKIWVTNSSGSRVLDSLTFSYGKNKEKYQRTIEASNGQNVRYTVQPVLINEAYPGTVVYGLASADRPHEPNAGYQVGYFDYGENVHFKIQRVNKPEGRGIGIEYYQNQKEHNRYGRVSALKLPLGSGGNYVPVYTFDYHTNSTEVLDAYNHKTTYYQKDRRLSKIVQGDYRAFQYIWDKKGKLLCKSLQSITGDVVKCTRFLYDTSGNPIEKILCGNISGDSPVSFKIDENGIPKELVDQAVHRFEYSAEGMNLKTKEILPNGTTIEYYYKPQTNLLSKKLTIANGEIHARTFNLYDDNAIIICAIDDDGTNSDFDSLEGVTCRLITDFAPELDPAAYGYTLPKLITESYLDKGTGKRIQLKSTELIYTQGDLVSEKLLYDANGKYSHSFFYEYNSHGKVVRETNPLGEATLYCYDANDNLVSQEKVGSGKKTRYCYDRANRLISETVVCVDGVTLSTTHTYDKLGNRLSTTDTYGTTHFAFDACSRETHRTDALGNIDRIEYDLADNPVKTIDKEGPATITTYNINGDPLKIQYPDGTEERFDYYLDGRLKRQWEKDGSYAGYSYDGLDHIIAKHHFRNDNTLVAVETHQYKGNNHISYTDVSGVTETYIYDGAGRKIGKIRGSQVESYAYDSLGRLWKTIRGDKVTIREYDLLDRIVETRTEDLQGKIYRKIQHAYDVNGNQVLEREYTSLSDYTEKWTCFNSLNLPIKEVDGEGNETHFYYSYNGSFEKTVIDPLGQITHEVYDPLKKLTLREVSHSGILLSRQVYTYNPNGHLIRRDDWDGSTFSWEYDPMGNVTRETEQGVKTTIKTYHQGRLASILKPDGILLSQTHDFFGNLATLTSSDGRIRHHFSYDNAGNILQAVDLNSHSSLERQYDEHNRIVSETLPSGLRTQFTYDTHDRLTSIRQANQTITYRYNPTDLMEVQIGPSTCTYNHDLSGNLITEKGFNGHQIQYRHDRNKRLISIHSPCYHQILQYDPKGNLIKSLTNGVAKQYRFDDLYQLALESGSFEHRYCFDSLNKRQEVDGRYYSYNQLNQLLSDGLTQYAYDLNGNRLVKGKNIYRYDALNRLVEVDGIRYRYDPLGRLVCRESHQEKEVFFYYKEKELGTPETIRIIGKGIAGILKDGRLYTVLRDHRDNVACVLNPEGHVAASYDYSAFGDVTARGDFSSPWQYSSQRLDPATGFLHFPNRVYDPEVGQWLTPDPLGIVDGPNLYAYVHNNPLVYIDPLGLWREQCRDFFAGLGRGAIDDMSWNASSHFMGKYQYNSTWSRVGYGVGVGTSCLLTYGLGIGEVTLAARGAFKAGGLAYTALKEAKSLNEAGKTIKLVKETTPQLKRISQTARNADLLPKKGAATARQIWSNTCTRTPVQNAYKHWKDHGSEFPLLNNAKEYVEDALNLLGNPAVLSKTRANGEFLRYHPESNTFGAYTVEGIPKTMFKPRAGKLYWEHQ